MSEKQRARVCAFLDRRAELYRLDPEVIEAIGDGEGNLLPLRASDLRVLLATQPPQDEPAQPVALSTLTDEEIDNAWDECEEAEAGSLRAWHAAVRWAQSLAASAPAQQAGQGDPTKTARAIMHELLETTFSEMPSFDHGKEAQEAWADRRAKARNDAAAFLAAAEIGSKEQGEAVAEICSTYELHWVGSEPVAEICRRTGAKVGDKLYLASTPPQPVAAEVEKDAARYRFLRMDAGIRNGRPFIAISSAGGISQWTGIFADKQIDAAMAGTGSDESKKGEAMANQKKLEQEVHAFNRRFHIGDDVDYYEVIESGESERYKTRTPAQILSGHTAVVWLEGKSGCVCCSHCFLPPGVDA